LKALVKAADALNTAIKGIQSKELKEPTATAVRAVS
jgi:hypothetical protein